MTQKYDNIMSQNMTQTMNIPQKQNMMHNRICDKQNIIYNRKQNRKQNKKQNIKQNTKQNMSQNMTQKIFQKEQNYNRSAVLKCSSFCFIKLFKFYYKNCIFV